MGLFDGSEAKSDEGSTMAVARLLDWPVLLVVPSAKAGRSLAAALRGFIAEAGSELIAGVILNGVSGRGHADYLREAIAPLKLPVFGAIPVCSELSWPERHLGLQARSGAQFSGPNGAREARAKDTSIYQPFLLWSSLLRVIRRHWIHRAKRVRIGLARDKAFHFYYEANLDYLRRNGAELVEFSPLHDSKLPPDLDGLIIGGGFPEVFADELSQNQLIRSEIYSAIADGLTCYAECGGLMWLCRRDR